MNMNKLTAALAITAAMTLCAPGAFSEESVSSLSNDIIAACPLSNCNKVTPSTAGCPKCQQKILSDCNTCKKKSNPCDPPKDECMPVNPCPVVSCDKPEEPSCAVCPKKDTDNRLMRQVYAYPAAIYGNNQVIGEHRNGIVLGEDTVVSSYSGITGAAAGILPMPMPAGIPVSRSIEPSCGCNNATGGAAPMPILNYCDNIEGIPVDRSVQNIDGIDCPIQMHTPTSIEAVKKSYVPYDLSTTSMTGAAAPLVSVFDDVPPGYWAGCEINKLTENNIIAGYPDRTFKPSLPVSRAEMATLTVKGFNLNDYGTCAQKHFSDVPANHWANKTISKAVSNGLMAGYPGNMFKPDQPVTRAEAFTILSHGINCPMDECKASEILNKYCDANTVPSWARISTAKAINAGALSNEPSPNLINPNKDASRAEIASMLENIRISLGYDSSDRMTASSCGCTGAAAFVENEQVVKLPTISMNFKDEINAKSAHVGDRFAAKTTAPVTIDGKVFPTGSNVHGQVLEVVRPSNGCQGSLRLSFDSIDNNGCKVSLPNEVLTAQVNKVNKPNFIARLVTMPFTLAGGLFGTVTRTVGGAFISAGNAVEQVVSGVGTGTGEIFQGQFAGAARSWGDAAKALVKAPIDTTRTALSGTMGLFAQTGDELAYLVDPKGSRVSSVNPREKVTVAFGCRER